MFRPIRAGLLAGVLVLGATACGGDDSSTETTAPVDAAPSETAADGSSDDTAAPDDIDVPATDPAVATFPVTVDGGSGPVTLDAAASRIVSLSPTHTEMLYAIGAGDQVHAVDSLSNYPPESADKLTELSAFEPNVEAIAGFEPDLVVIGDDSSGISGQLTGLGIPVWFGPAAVTFDDVYAQLEQLGALTGQVGGAAEVVLQMRTDIDEILASVPESPEPLTYYHELDNTYFSVTSNTFIGQTYTLLGLRNIADMTEGQTDYPQLSAEFIVSQDPDIIFLADTKCCGQTAQTVAERPGWQDLQAVRNGTVIEMDDDIASRWGPRVVEYLRLASEAVATAVAANAAS
jgi:iron complex transport system substrate-binding protein